MPTERQTRRGTNSEDRLSCKQRKPPTLDQLAESGRLGTTLIAGDEDAVGEAASCLGILGYRPERYPAGEGVLSAHGRGLNLGPDDQPFLCDFVTVLDGHLRDLTAGGISAAEGKRLIRDMNASIAGPDFRFESCSGFRNLCIWKGAGALPKLRLVPPERVLGQKIRGQMPRGAGRPLFELMMTAEVFLGRTRRKHRPARFGRKPRFSDLDPRLRPAAGAAGICGAIRSVTA